jgi:hypothetical protein
MVETNEPAESETPRAHFRGLEQAASDRMALAA